MVEGTTEKQVTARFVTSSTKIAVEVISGAFPTQEITCSQNVLCIRCTFLKDIGAIFIGTLDPFPTDDLVHKLSSV